MSSRLCGSFQSTYKEVVVLVQQGSGASKYMKMTTPGRAMLDFVHLNRFNNYLRHKPSSKIRHSKVRRVQHRDTRHVPLRPAQDGQG